MTDPLLHLIDDDSTQSPPSMSTLNQDLLWQIFMMTADMTQDNERNSVFYNIIQASQVCRTWRDLLLGSPSLWARIIDLTILSKASDDLRKEILGRTGTSLLSIKGRISDSASSESLVDSSSPVGFFLALLRDEWARIRHLDVILHDSVFNLLTGPLSDLLSRPAPTLCTFKFSLSYNIRYHIQNHLPRDLFCGDAPVLAEFAFPTSHLNIEASWLPTLLSLELPAHPQVLNVLEKTINLQILCFDERRQLVHSDPNTALFDPHNRRIPLDKLHRVQLKEISESSLRLIDQVVPAPSCTLEISSVNFDFLVPTNPRATLIKSLITRFAKSSQDCGDISFISFNYNQSSFALMTGLSAHDQPSGVSGESTKAVLSESTFTFLLDTISHFEIGMVTTLHMAINSVTLYMLKSRGTHATRNFFSAFQSLETLRANPDLLNFLLFSFRPDQPIFPLLRTVEVIDSNDWSHKDFVHAFLQHHAASGGQIVTLDLSGCTNPVFLETSFLEQMKALNLQVIRPRFVIFPKTNRRGRVAQQEFSEKVPMTS